ncbi:MAG: hypothetical protein ACREJU_15535 [Nitrospiraceae bacterium]
MSWKLIVLAGGALALAAYASLSFLNPTLAGYQQAILISLADQEAERFAVADRRAIEQEAARLTSQFVAVRYDARQLDAATIQRNHPLLGAALSHQNQSSGRTLTENLAISKEHALKRVVVTRNAMRYSILVDLTTHTTRISYRLWSYFSTCHEKKALAYTGVAGRFYERADHECATGALP